MKAGEQNPLDGIHVDPDALAGLRQLRQQMDTALGGDAVAFAKEIDLLLSSGRYLAAWKLWRSCDREAYRGALLDMGPLVDRVRWYVSGVEVPRPAEEAIRAAPRKTWKSMIAGVESAIRGLASIHPRLDRILDTAATRREEGQVFAEASRERRDQLYAERVEWVAKTYSEVRGKYAPGDDGDKAARLEVAVKYSRITGKKPMCDRSVCNLLRAASKVDAKATVETAE